LIHNVRVDFLHSLGKPLYRAGKINFDRFQPAGNIGECDVHNLRECDVKEII